MEGLHPDQGQIAMVYNDPPKTIQEPTSDQVPPPPFAAPLDLPRRFLVFLFFSLCCREPAAPELAGPEGAARFFGAAGIRPLGGAAAPVEHGREGRVRRAARDNGGQDRRALLSAGAAGRVYRGGAGLRCGGGV